MDGTNTITLTQAEADQIADALIDAMAVLDSGNDAYAALEAVSLILHRKSMSN
ncbi:MAG: hypothetical protein ABJL67_12650 [Sulfitobacter sp.]